MPDLSVRTELGRRLRAAPPPAAVRAVALASLVANVGIVLTGGAVRLTGSGLGCPTWPRCTDTSYVVRGELGPHGVIEFGNRMLTFAVAAVALATVVVIWRARPRDREARLLAVVLAVGVPAQAVLGGLTVLTDLNPWLVAFHLLLSLAMIAVSVRLLHHLGAQSPVPTGAAVPTGAVASGGSAWSAPVAARRLALATYLVLWMVLYLGTVVTGSGPHAGDVDAPRTGLDPALVSQLHADAVLVLVGLTIGLLVTIRVTDGTPGALRAGQWLLGIEIAQGLVGVVQYRTDLPVLLVELHLLGACATVIAATALLLRVPRGLPPSG